MFIFLFIWVSHLCYVCSKRNTRASFSILKINIKQDKCVECFACERECPMDIELLNYMYEGKRVLSTECISCMTCIYVCPTEAVEYTVGLDGDLKEYLRSYGELVAMKKIENR